MPMGVDLEFSQVVERKGPFLQSKREALVSGWEVR
jgi:hypothetical protein